MAAKDDAKDNGFEETTDMPVGRKALRVPQSLWNALEDSAKRGVAFAKTGSDTDIDELRRYLGAAAVKAKYFVTAETEKPGAEKPRRPKLKTGTMRVTFSAVEKAPGERPAGDANDESA